MKLLQTLTTTTTTTILTLLTLTSPALSLPSNLTGRIEARSQTRHQSTPLLRLPNPNLSNLRTDAKITYSTNWAGVVRENPPPVPGTSARAHYTAASATFTVPKPTATPGANKNSLQAGSAWVGIDGNTHTAAILQTGVDFYIVDGEIHNDAWFEWFPDYAYDFPDVEVRTGDVIVARVEAFSEREGVAVIENKSTGRSATQVLRAPAAEATLRGENAEWIVEDFKSGDRLVDLVDFGSVRFWGAGAEGSTGGKFGLDGGTVIELVQDGRVITEVVVEGDREMTVNCKL